MGYVSRGLSGFSGFSGLNGLNGLSGLSGLSGQWTQTDCQTPDLRSSVLFSCSYQFALFFSRKKREAMVDDFNTFDSHPPFLLNGDVGTGCLRVAFQQVSPCTSLLSLCVQGRRNLRDHGTSLFLSRFGRVPLILASLLFGGRM